MHGSDGVDAGPNMLGAKNVACQGIKVCAPLLRIKNATALDASIAGRQRWVFSALTREDEVIADAEILIKNFPDIFTVIIPRHLKGASIATSLKQKAIGIGSE